MAEDSSKPAVLIIGGLGFIGRHLALHIHENKLASEVRLVDKLLPQLAWLAPEFSEACSADKFVQADASREQSFPRIFDRANGKQFDFVINCGGESRLSQPDDVYRLRSHALSIALGKEAARRQIPAFIECSTATVYKGDRRPCKEGDKTKPSSDLARWKLKTEEDLQKIDGLNLCILRFARLYGEYDSGFLTTPICLARVYQDLERPLPFLFPKDQPMNTVHVKDAVRALWHAAEWRKAQTLQTPTPTAVPVIFNIVDRNNTSKGALADALSRTFGIECTFMNTLMAQLAKMNIEEVLDEVNEEALEVWTDLLNEKGITRPGPINPFLEKELLKDTDLCVDGSLFEQTTGFEYLYKTPPPDWIESVIKSYERMNWWP
ncbi:hypothetical protein VTO42DRAFT_6728 [Malbranchea cinnamomea]